MDEPDEVDLVDEGERQLAKIEANDKLLQQARQIQAKQDAFRDIADRFYLIWWNLPGSTLRQADRDLQDLFRMYMDLAPSLGVSRNGIPELRECCGRRRTWKDDLFSGQAGDVLVMPPVADPKETLGWCPGDILRRLTRLLGFAYCEKCDARRRKINAFFRCGR